MPLRDIAGHRHLTALLARAVARETLPPTLLFAGPSGVGKWTTALAVAQALNCPQPVRDGTADCPALDACGACRACERIARLAHVDVLAVEPDERVSIKVDIIRDVLSRTVYRPFEGRRRVVLVRDAETLEVSSQNALLKSLEEPPPSTVFILVTAAPGALLPTVRSRSLTLRFGLLTAKEVAAVLAQRHGLAADRAQALAALAGGSVGDALAQQDTDVASLRQLALHLLRHSADRFDPQVRLQAAAEVTGSGGPAKERRREDVAAVLRVLAALLRDIEILNRGADRRWLAHPAAVEELDRLAPRFAGDRAGEAFGAVTRALDALDRNAGTKVVTEWLAVHL